GHFEKGLRKYEWRWLDGATAPAWREFPQPLWMGKSSLSGKTILLHAEQGLGDTIQFIRFVPLLVARGAKVFLGVPPPLSRLLRGMDGVERMVTWGEPIPTTDFHCPLLSIPLALDISPDNIPEPIGFPFFDTARAEEFGKLLERRRRKLVGVCWSGNPSHHDDHERSIRFQEFANLFSVAGFKF